MKQGIPFKHCAFKRIIFGFALLLNFASDAQPIQTVVLKEKEFIVCRVDPLRQRLHLFLRDDEGKAFNSFDSLADSLRSQGNKLLFAMNAGMYEADYSPVGLFVENGKMFHELNLNNGEGNFYLKPNGIFMMTSKGALIIESSLYPKLKETAVLATQSGPLLVHNGIINSSFGTNSPNRCIRNGVGISQSNEVTFAISEVPVTFYEFAVLFRDKLHCPEALYLDGNVSSLYSSDLKRDDKKSQLGPIIGITEF